VVMGPVVPASLPTGRAGRDGTVPRYRRYAPNHRQPWGPMRSARARRTA